MSLRVTRRGSSPGGAFPSPLIAPFLNASAFPQTGEFRDGPGTMYASLVILSDPPRACVLAGRPLSEGLTLWIHAMSFET